MFSEMMSGAGSDSGGMLDWLKNNVSGYVSGPGYSFGYDARQAEMQKMLKLLKRRLSDRSATVSPNKTTDAKEYGNYGRNITPTFNQLLDPFGYGGME